METSVTNVMMLKTVPPVWRTPVETLKLTEKVNYVNVPMVSEPKLMVQEEMNY